MKEKTAGSGSHLLTAGAGLLGGTLMGASAMNELRKRDVARASLVYGNTGAYLQRTKPGAALAAVPIHSKGIGFVGFTNPEHIKKVDEGHAKLLSRVYRNPEHAVLMQKAEGGQEKSAFYRGFEKAAAAHAAELAGLGILAAPSVAHFAGHEPSERTKHVAELAGLGVLAAPSLAHYGQKGFDLLKRFKK